MHFLFVGVFGCACAVILCGTCYNVRRYPRLAQAYLQRKAKIDAPINNSYVCGSSQIAAADWLEHGSDRWVERGSDCVVQPGQQQGLLGAADAILPSKDSGGTSAQHARVQPALSLFGWHRLALSGPPLSSSMAHGPAEDASVERPRTQINSNDFAPPQFTVLATGNARVAMIKPLRQCFMMHSVVHTVSAKMLKDVLLEAAELHKLEPHPNLLPLRAVVTDQPWGEVGLLSELTTGSLATLLDTSPVELTWANGLLSLATDVAKGLAHLHGLGLWCAATLKNPYSRA